MKSRKRFVTGVIFIFAALGISVVDVRVAQTSTSVLGKSNEQVINASRSSANNKNHHQGSRQPKCTCWVDWDDDVFLAVPF